LLTVDAEARGSGWVEVVYDTPDAFLHRCAAEVEEEANAEVRETQVCKELLLVYGGEALEGFHFDDDALVDDQVQAKSLLERHTSMRQGDRSLTFDAKPTLLKGTAEQPLIHRFAKTRAHLSVNADRRVDDRAGDIVELHQPLLSVRSPTTSVREES
jgi:hypothetical protein